MNCAGGGCSKSVVSWACRVQVSRCVLSDCFRLPPAGFCYINDIVLAILELLKYNQR